MSPEQAKGQGEVDLAPDLWALGLHRLRVPDRDHGLERRAGRGDDPRADRRGARSRSPPSCARICRRNSTAWFAKALERDPRKRFQTARELAETLSEALTPATSMPPPSWRQSSAPSDEEGALIDELVDQTRPGALAPPPAPRMPARRAGGAARSGAQRSAARARAVRSASSACSWAWRCWPSAVTRSGSTCCTHRRQTARPMPSASGAPSASATPAATAVGTDLRPAARDGRLRPAHLARRKRCSSAARATRRSRRSRRRSTTAAPASRAAC